MEISQSCQKSLLQYLRLKLVGEVDFRQDGDIVFVNKDLTAKAYSEAFPFFASK